jgi:AcrR family transcriptional regulator
MLTQKRRAIKASDKQLRFQDILNTALQIFEQKSFQDLTMAELATQTGLAKGTLYLYFKTKEEVFLAVLEQLLDNWFEEVNSRLAKGPITVPELVDLFTEALKRQTSLGRLLAMNNSVLEQNIELERALHYKHYLTTNLNRTGALLEQSLPGLQVAGEGALLLLRTQALLVGLQNLADPPVMIQQLIKSKPELAILDIDFDSQLVQTLTILLQGSVQQYH